MSKAADKPSRIKTENWAMTFAVHIFIERPPLKPGWLTSRRKKLTSLQTNLFENCTFKNLSQKLKVKDQSDLKVSNINTGATWDSMSCPRTLGQFEREIKPPTLYLLDDLLHLLSHSHPPATMWWGKCLL